MSSHSTKIIVYLRVSTKRQGDSGLGLDSQRSTVEAYAARIGANIMASYTEVESGKRSDRPELAKALAHARRSKATLVVAKLDRLSRNVAFLSAIMESGCEFTALDMPAANRFMLHVMAALAEHETKIIGERTKAALGALKARGTLLGSARPGHWAGREDRRLAGARKGAIASAVSHRESVHAAYADLRDAMEQERARGATLQAIADRLNADGHTTRTGKQWNHVQVSRVLA